MKMQQVFFKAMFFLGLMFQVSFAAAEKDVQNKWDEENFSSFIDECLYKYRGYVGEGGESALHYLKSIYKSFVALDLARQKELLAHVDSSGWTALHAFARVDKCIEFFFLLSLGADLTLQSKYGETPYKIACKESSEAVKQLIKIHTFFEEAKKSEHPHKKNNNAQKIWKLYNAKSLATTSCINLLMSLSEEQKNSFLSDESVLFEALRQISLHKNYKPLFILLYLQPIFSDEVYEEVDRRYSHKGSPYLLLNIYKLCFQRNDKEEE